jgi:hypothetical protein
MPAMTIDAPAVIAAATYGLVSPAIGPVEAAVPGCTPGALDTAMQSADAVALGFAYRARCCAGRLNDRTQSVIVVGDPMVNPDHP